MVEEGDDRFRPALNFYGGYDHFYYARIYYYGKTYGPVTERTTMIALNRKFGLFRTQSLVAGVGVSLLLEQTAIAFDKAEDKEFDIAESRFNAGAFAGIYWQPEITDAIFTSIGWESGLFPAGLSGGIFLATGRKQYLSAIVGVKL